MKQRHLRKSIQTILELITFCGVGFLCMLVDFSLSFAPVLVAIIGVLAFNTWVLVNWGKYEGD